MNKSKKKVAKPLIPKEHHTKKELDKELDEALKNTFPASDSTAKY